MQHFSQFLAILARPATPIAHILCGLRMYYLFFLITIVLPVTQTLSFTIRVSQETLQSPTTANTTTNSSGEAGAQPTLQPDQPSAISATVGVPVSPAPVDTDTSTRVTAFASDWTTVVQAASAGIVAIFTIWLTRATAHYAQTADAQLKELRRARLAEAAAYVITYFDIPWGDFSVHIVVKNIGHSAAQAVRVEFEPPLSTRADSSTKLPLPEFLTGTVPFLPPAYELRSSLWSAVDLLGDASLIPQSYRARVSYTDMASGEQRSEEYLLDFTGFRGLVYERPTTLREVHAALASLVERQAAVAHSLEAMSATLSRGVFVSNGSLIIEDRYDRRSHEERVHDKMFEITATWQAWRQQGQAGYSSVGELTSRLHVLQNQLQYLVASCTDPSLCAVAYRVSSTLTELLHYRFYIDGGASHQRFSEAGDKLLEHARASRGSTQNGGRGDLLSGFMRRLTRWLGWFRDNHWVRGMQRTRLRRWS